MKELSRDINLVIAEPRKLAIRFNHGFIDYTHLFVAVTLDTLISISEALQVPLKKLVDF
jgi:hypothetical protein